MLQQSKSAEEAFNRLSDDTGALREVVIITTNNIITTTAIIITTTTNIITTRIWRRCALCWVSTTTKKLCSERWQSTPPRTHNT